MSEKGAPIGKKPRSKYVETMEAGSRFGRLVSTGQHRSVTSYMEWLFTCDCGKTKWISGSNVALGKVQSCGCLQSERSASRCKERATRGGITTHPLFGVWRSMMQRCYTVGSPSYHKYGGRGITVHAEWHSAENFFRDNIERWGPGLNLDRVDNDGNYSLGNTRFVTPKENQRNRRNTRYLTVNGETKSLPEWADLYDVPQKLVRQRIDRDGRTVIGALTGVYDAK